MQSSRTAAPLLKATLSIEDCLLDKGLKGLPRAIAFPSVSVPDDVNERDQIAGGYVVKAPAATPQRNDTTSPKDALPRLSLLRRHSGGHGSEAECQDDSP